MIVVILDNGFHQIESRNLFSKIGFYIYQTNFREKIMSKTAILTDSTAYIPQEYLQKCNIDVVPLAVIWGEQTYEDGVNIQPDEFYNRLSTAKILPTTSQVTVYNMQNAFERLVGEGYDVLGIFISSKLSGTIQSAIQAREGLGTGKEKVQIFDSNSTAMAMGFQVIATARAAQQGATIDECKKLAERARECTGVYFVVDTLEFLHRGGRIGGAKRLLGTALNLKPILSIQDGKVEAMESIRTKAKATSRLIEIIQEKTAGKSNIRLATLHANAAEAGKEMLENAGRIINPIESIFTSVSPAIGTHTGPGTVGLAYMTDL